MELKEKAEVLTDHIGDYIETRYKIIVLNATEKITGIASSSLTAMVVGLLSLFVLLFGGIGLGWWIGQQLDNMVAGFCIVAGLFLFFIVLAILLRKTVLAPWIRNTIIKKAYE